MAINRALPLQNALRVSQEPQAVHNISFKKDRSSFFLKGMAVLSLFVSISAVAAGAFLLLSGYSAFLIGSYSIGAKPLFILGGMTAIVGAISGCLFYKKRNALLPAQPLAPLKTVVGPGGIAQPQQLSSQARTMMATFFATGFFTEAMVAHIDDRLPQFSTPETIRDVYHQYIQVNRHAKWSEAWGDGESLKVADAIKLFNKDNRPFLIKCLDTHSLKAKSDWTQFLENLPIGKGAVISKGNDSVSIRHVRDNAWEFFNPQSLQLISCFSPTETEGYIQELVDGLNSIPGETMEAFVLELY